MPPRPSRGRVGWIPTPEPPPTKIEFGLDVLCPFCKGTGKKRGICGMCRGTGVIRDK